MGNKTRQKQQARSRVKAQAKLDTTPMDLKDPHHTNGAMMFVIEAVIHLQPDMTYTLEIREGQLRTLPTNSKQFNAWAQENGPSIGARYLEESAKNWAAYLQNQRDAETLAKRAAADHAASSDAPLILVRK